MPVEKLKLPNLPFLMLKVTHKKLGYAKGWVCPPINKLAFLKTAALEHNFKLLCVVCVFYVLLKQLRLNFAHRLQ